MPYLRYPNSKYRKRYGGSLRIFGLPAYESKDGFVTCPGAGECVRGCYARQGWYAQIKAVAAARESNLLLAREGPFVATIAGELKRSKSIKYVRIHDSGDFFSRTYLLQWYEIASRNPWVIFFAYTKAIPLINRTLSHKPRNVLIAFSEGGRYENEIDQERDTFTRVFPSAEAMKGTGFVNASTGDDLGYMRRNYRKLGLVYHGRPGRWFATDGCCPTLPGTERKGGS